MTVDQCDALDELRERLDHTAAIASLVSDHEFVKGEATDAVRGIGKTLSELAARLDDIVNPARP